MALLASTQIVYQPTGWQPVESVTESISGTSAGVSEDSAAVSVLASIAGTSAGTSEDAGVVSTGAEVEPVFSDSFESGDSSHTENGFTWNLTGPRVTVSTDRARTGAHSLKFHFTTAGGAEQRVNLGGDYTAIWLEWWVYWPADWDHPPFPPANNDKFLAVWGGTHSQYNDGGSPGIILEFIDDNTFSSSGARNCQLRVTYFRNGGRLNLTPPSGAPVAPWLTDTGPMLRGQWNRMRLHLDAGTSADNDGIYDIWTNDVKVFEWHTVPFWVPDTDPGPNAFSSAYFMGSSATDPDDAAWYIDDVKLYVSDPGWE